MLNISDLERFIKLISKDGNYMYVFVISIGLVHCGFLVLFLAYGIGQMALVNCFSVIAYVFIIFLASKNLLHISGPLTFLEIIIHQIFGFYYCGPESGFEMLLFCLFFAQFGMLKSRFSIMLSSLFLAFCMMARYYVDTLDISWVFSSLYLSNQHYHQIHSVTYPINLILTIAFMLVYGFMANANQSGRIDDLLNLIYKDFLTGLYNRKFLEERAWPELCKKEHLLVCICDIDNFKSVNDTYGHAVGDLVLKYTSMLMQQEAIAAQRLGNIIHIGRWGGEEFLIIADFSNSQTAREFLENIRIGISQHEFSELDHNVTLTLGAAYISCVDKNSLSDYVKTADECLYQGKKTTKNTIVCKLIA